MLELSVNLCEVIRLLPHRRKSVSICSRYDTGLTRASSELYNIWSSLYAAVVHKVYDVSRMSIGYRSPRSVLSVIIHENASHY